MQLAGMFFGDFQFQMVGFIFLFNSVKVQCYYSFEYWYGRKQLSSHPNVGMHAF